jgi:excisionase family DNA binding protein
MTGGLLTYAETARLLAVSERTLRRWVAAGAIPVFRHGRVTRVRMIDVERFMSEYTTAAAPAAAERLSDYRVEPGEWD